MKERKVAAEGASIVIKGKFNPAIFSPLWLEQVGLIGAPELKNQEIEIITQDLASFRAGWLGCHVSADAMQVETGVPEEFERLRDVAVGVLRTLPYTPISSLGINRDVHFSVETLSEWHGIGDALVPKDPWMDVLKVPGMRTLVVWGARPDEYNGAVQIKIEPSFRYPQSVYVGTNDHFVLTRGTGDEPKRDAAWSISDDELEVTSEKIPVATQILLEEWSASMVRAESYLQVVSQQGVNKQ